jgi:molecular chaperone GrpE
MVRAQLEKVFEDRGATRIPASGVPFDPRRHEGVLTEERADVPENTATQELRRGYIMKDRVLRAAQVKVSRAAPKPQ